MEQLYFDWVVSGAQGNPFDAAIKKLKFPMALNGVSMDSVPSEGGLLLVANHPFGLADGLALGWLATQLRESVCILTHSLLCRVPEFRPFLMPVDFGETSQARRNSAKTRRMAADLLKSGGAVVIFPGGSVATSNQPFRRPAAELPWHPFVTRLALTENTTVLPVHVHGQNSSLFQVTSHVSYPLRAALLFRETRRRMGGDMRMTLGTPVMANELARFTRSEITDIFRRRCLELGDADPEENFVWPSYIKW
ncbi:MAG: lysophospholipid acyltransferase family protein [Marinibacterium sp.]|nr:lysophospholipid acyltransferase family protein [Marinibacterium sp.]